ncbi:hypothetical protein Dsin_027958 [Dipteronia sinensis]|uniref:Reverse transcriptase zinc-binding domain-containing protein n=1 Tax=Dipteronia sinensis TaxID=43782 RepID=A0AAE0DV38_9ROSI|nr:hypothetical protein Dsin_027958 [Dipteronia sinensis]
MGKDVGGLGFRDLLIFNKALIAKQCWKLISRPNSLTARVLKGCYYPNTSFLVAKPLPSGSMIWKGLIWGRDIIEAGSRWRIGNGSSVKIYGDRWLPRPVTFKTVSPQILDEHTTVSDLFISPGVWDMTCIRASFHVDDAEAILSLPLSSSDLPDRLIWHFEKSRDYYVRSGYQVGCDWMSQASSSRLGRLNDWWNYLWRLRIPPKIKHFIWKACHHWLPTLVNLARSGVKTDVLCSQCKRKAETTCHALWGCPKAKHNRTGCDFLVGIWWGDESHFQDLMVLCANKLASRDFEIFCVLLWRTWFKRNQKVHGNWCDTSEDVLGWSVCFLNEFQNTNWPDEKHKNVAQATKMNWVNPDVGTFKVNTAAVSNGNHYKTGIGVIVRDHKGLVMGAITQPILSLYSPQVAKAIAILKGIQFAMEKDLLPTVIESDAKGVVELINRGVTPCSDVGVITTDILALLATRPISIVYSSRPTNIVAVKLAKIASLATSSKIWVNSAPLSVENLVRGDYTC